jgi:hypothetical protein
VPLPGVPRAGDASMKVTIDVPRKYAIAIRRGLRQRGYRHDDAQVRRVLRYVIRETMRRHWWQKVGARLGWGG